MCNGCILCCCCVDKYLMFLGPAMGTANLTFEVNVMLMLMFLYFVTEYSVS